jgi:lysophospholipase L1-like esterase
MPAKIQYFDLVKKAQQGKLGPEEMNRYFVVDAAKSTAFNPRFRLNYDAVDVTGMEATAAASGHGLALDGSSKLRPQTRAVQPDGSWVAEGDSWFRLPAFIYPETMLDFAAETRPITNLAHWGDTLNQMITLGQYLPFLRTRKTQFLLISGGGNDVLGQNLEQCLNLFDARFTTPEHASFYVRQLFFDQLDAVERQFMTIVNQVSSISPTTRLVLHGYDYARPIEHGVFLGQHFERRGIMPRADGPLCRAIVKFMIDQFNKRLASIAEHYEFVTFLDFRGTILDGQWFDELHPKSAGAKALSVKLLAHLQEFSAVA